MNKKDRIYVAGHTGLVGSAIIRNLKEKGYENVFTERTWSSYLEKQPKLFPEENSRVHDLREKDLACYIINNIRPDVVFNCAAKVGGILANNNAQAEFLYDNLMISANIIHAAHKYGVKKLLNLGSVCMYPREAPTPIKEESICNGLFEPTNEGYAVAKVTAAKMCQMYNKQYDTQYYTLVPCNLYGPNDNFDPQSSHVLPALIRKFHRAKLSNADVVSLWGSGKAVREFLYVDDLADIAVRLMEVPMLKNYTWARGTRCIYNIGGSIKLSIHNLAQTIAEVIGYKGLMTYDNIKPDGAPLRELDDSRLFSIIERPAKMTQIREGIRKTYQWALENDVFSRET